MVPVVGPDRNVWREQFHISVCDEPWIVLQDGSAEWSLIKCIRTPESLVLFVGGEDNTQGVVYVARCLFSNSAS